MTSKYCYIHILISHRQLHFEKPLLKEVQASVERIYENGRPLCQLPSARSTTYDQTQANVSSIFVIDCAAFKKMKPATIQEIFQHRHILVENVKTEEMEFDLFGLACLGSISLPRSIQGQSQLFSPKRYISHMYVFQTSRRFAICRQS